MGKRLVAGLPVPRERRASDKTGGKDLWAFWGVEKWPSEGGLSPLRWGMLEQPCTGISYYYILGSRSSLLYMLIQAERKAEGFTSQASRSWSSSTLKAKWSFQNPKNEGRGA